MNETISDLINQSMETLEKAINSMEDSYNKTELQKILDEFHCTVNNLD